MTNEEVRERIIELANGHRDASDIVISILAVRPAEHQIRNELWRLVNDRVLEFDDDLRLRKVNDDPTN